MKKILHIHDYCNNLKKICTKIVSKNYIDFFKCIYKVIFLQIKACL